MIIMVPAPKFQLQSTTTYKVNGRAEAAEVEMMVTIGEVAVMIGEMTPAVGKAEERRPVVLLAKPAGQLTHMSFVVFPKLLSLAYLPAPQAVHFGLHSDVWQFDRERPGRGRWGSRSIR